MLSVCLQAGAGLNDALLRASAERAAQAILMTPLVSHDYDDEDHRLASKVMTGTKGQHSLSLIHLNPVSPYQACCGLSTDAHAMATTQYVADGNNHNDSPELYCCVIFMWCCVADAVVVNRYQLLKGINPSIDLVTEMMLPQSVSFLSPTTPVRGVDHRYLHLLSPAYISGSGEWCLCLSQGL